MWSCSQEYGDVVNVCLLLAKSSACQGDVYAVDMCLCRVPVEALTFLSSVLGNLWPEARMRRNGWPCQDLSERLVSARGHSILWSADWWHCSVTCESSRWLCRALSCPSFVKVSAHQKDCRRLIRTPPVHYCHLDLLHRRLMMSCILRLLKYYLRLAVDFRLVFPKIHYLSLNKPSASGVTQTSSVNLSPYKSSSKEWPIALNRIYMHENLSLSSTPLFPDG